MTVRAVGLDDVRHEKDAVHHGHAEQGDESDGRRHRQDGVREVERKNTAHRGKRHVEKHHDGRKRCPKGQVQKREDDDDRNRNDDHEARHRSPLILELAAPREVIPFGQFHFAADGRLDLVDERAHVASLDVAFERQEPAALLAVDLGAAHVHVHVGERTERQAHGPRGNFELAHRVGVPFRGARQLDAHADLAFPLPHRSGERSAVRALERLLDILHRQADARGGLAIDIGDDVLRFAGAVDFDVPRAFRPAQDPLHLDELLVHDAEVVPVDLHHDLPADARDRLLDAIFDGLAEVVVDAGPLLELGPHGVDDLGFRSSARPLGFGLHHDERFGLVRRLVVGAVLGMALLGQDVTHLLKFQECEPRVAEHFAAAFERSLGGHGDGDVDVPLVHLGQELGAEARDEGHGDRQDRRAERAGHHGIPKGSPQRAEVALAQENEKLRLDLLDLAVTQEHRNQRRHAGEREQERAAERERVRERDRSEDAPFHPFEREDGQHGGHDDGQRK